MTDTGSHTDRVTDPDTATANGERAPHRGTERIESGVHDLHVPEPSAAAEKALVTAGVVLPILGLIIIAVAGYRAGGTVYVADQVPMLITGGILGLGLILVGIALFLRFSMARLLRFWLVRLVAEQNAQTDRLLGARDEADRR